MPLLASLAPSSAEYKALLMEGTPNIRTDLFWGQLAG